MDSHANVENVVNAARNPVTTNIFILLEIKILFCKIPINTPKKNDPKIFIKSIAIGISKIIKFFKKLLDK